MSGEENQVKWRGVQPVDGIRGVWPARDAVRFTASEWRAGIGTTLMYTVPVGMIAYITTAGLASLSTGAAAVSARLEVRNALDVLQYYMFYHYFAIPGQFTSFVTFLPGREAEAGWKINVYSNNAIVSARGLVFGWLEDA